MNVSHRISDGDHHLLLIGELDLATAELLHEHVERALATRPARLVVDLANLTFCDSTGIGALVDAARTAEARRTGFQVTNAHGVTRTAMQVIGVFDRLTAAP